MATARKTDKTPNFETALQKLEAIVKKLEEEEIPLEASLQYFEEGQALVRACEIRLREAENRINMLLETAAGEIAEEPFAADGQNETDEGDNDKDEGEDDDDDPETGGPAPSASPKINDDPDDLPF